MKKRRGAWSLVARPMILLLQGQQQRSDGEGESILKMTTVVTSAMKAKKMQKVRRE
jgi:hypothetical protein